MKIKKYKGAWTIMTGQQEDEIVFIVKSGFCQPQLYYLIYETPYDNMKNHKEILAFTLGEVAKFLEIDINKLNEALNEKVKLQISLE